jgi:hypothetical protein
VADEDFSTYIKALKSIYGVIGSVGVLVPAMAAFMSTYPPPPRSVTAPLTAALAGAALIATYYYPSKPPSERTTLPPLVKRALIALCCSVFLLIVYIRVIGLLTVATLDGLERFQIGFYTAEWGLTSEGLNVRTADPEGTPYAWLRDDGLLSSQGPSELWKWWAIDLSALTAFILFALSFVVWSHGWALLAKQRTLEDDSAG